MRNKDKPWFDDQCRPAFGLKQEAHLRWKRDRSRVNWEEFVRCQVRANETYSDHNFDSKQSREAVELPLTCHPSPSFTTFAFRSSEVRRLLLNLDPYGGTDPLGLFPIFLNRTVDVMAPRLSVVFRWLVRLGSFPACWRHPNVPQFRKVHRPLLLQITDQFP